MNIIDAIKSGKPFRRKQTTIWNYDGDGGCTFTIDDILATDWEIEERKIEITEGDFDEAVKEIRFHGVTCATRLKKRLFAARSGE